MFTKRLLNSLSAIVIVLGSQSFCQTASSVTQDAKNSSCSNIIALAGDVKVDCSSLTPAQQKIIENIPAVLHKILKNHLDTDAVMAKLDEILNAINPNLPVKTYYCEGDWKIIGPSASSSMMITTGGDASNLKELVSLYNAEQFSNLLKTCLADVHSMPEWLTPRIFCGLAYVGLGDKAKAKEMLAEFDSNTGPAYSDGTCKQASDELRRHLQ